MNLPPQIKFPVLTPTPLFLASKVAKDCPRDGNDCPRERKDFDPFQIASKIMDSKQAWLFHDI
jgi:hypothetical protein